MEFCIPCSFLLIDWQRECDPSTRVVAGRASLHRSLPPVIVIYKELCKASHLFATGRRLTNILATQNKTNKDAKLAHVKGRIEKMK